MAGVQWGQELSVHARALALAVALLVALSPTKASAASSETEPVCANPTPIASSPLPTMTVPTAEGPIVIYPPTATTVAIDGSDKFVFRTPGTGPIQLSAIGPGGRHITPAELSYHGLDPSQ